MNNEREFRDELDAICKKYSVRNGVFGGNNESEFIGYFGLGETEYLMPCLVEGVSNSARLYQSGREKILGAFDKQATRRLP